MMIGITDGKLLCVLEAYKLQFLSALLGAADALLIEPLIIIADLTTINQDFIWGL